MECNFIMERLITRVYRCGVQPDCSVNIKKMKTLDGNYFWVLENFCGIPIDNVTEYGKDLTDLEWRGNELYFTDDSCEMLEKKVISAYLGLKQQIEEKYPETLFDLVVSVDTDSRTGNIRLYEVRDGYHYIEPTHENLSGCSEVAVLVDTVNDVKLEKYIPILTEDLKEYQLEIYYTEEKEIKIRNPYYDEHIYISWDDEFTLYFCNWHSHYYEDDWDELVEDIKGFITGNIVTVRADCNGRWLGGLLSSPENIPVTSKSKLLKFFYLDKKDYLLQKDIKDYGIVVSVEGWNPENNRNYTVS